MLKRTMLILFTLGGMLSISYAFYNINLSASGINYQAGGNVNGRVNIAPANISAQNSGLRRGDKFYLNVKNPVTNDKLGWILAGADVGISGIVLTTEGITQPIAASAKPTVATTTFYRDTNLPLVMDPFIANMQSVDQDFLLERDVSGLENLADIQANYSPWPSDVGYVQYVTTKDYITGKSPFLLGDPADTVWTTSSPNVPANKRTFPAPYDLTFDDLLCTFDYWMPYSGIQPTGTRYNQWGVISTTSSYPQPYTNLATVRPAAHITLGNIVFALSQGSQSGYATVGTPIVGSGNLCLAAAQDETMKLRVADPSLSISFNAIKNKNQAVVGKVVENGSVYLAVDANAGTNHTVSALIFDASGEFKYYLPLEPAKGNDLYELDVKGIPLGVYSISVANEVYDETDMRPASSSRLSNALPLEIVTGHELQYTNTPQGGNDYEYGKNVTIGATVGSIALNPVGFPPITYKMESDGDQTYQNFEISGLDSNGASSATLLNVKVKAGGPDLANGGLKAGTYKFCISSNDANGYPDVQIPNKTKICTSFVVKKTSINSVVFDQPNQTIKTITEASTNWYEPASANPAHGIKITYSIAGGDIGLIDIDPDSGAISYKGKGAYGKVKIKASADDDPSTGYDNYLPAYAEKEIVIVREVDGVVIPDQASSDKDIPTFSSDKANIKTNGVIGKIQGTLGAPDTIGGSVTTYTYAVKAGGDSNFFTVNTNSGEIKTNANLAVGSYTFTVTVSDKWSSKDIPVTVNVGMANAEDLKFYENSTSNTIINQKTVNFTDTNVSVYATVKGSTNNNPVTYYLKAGEPTNVVDVNPNSGALTIKGSGTVVIEATKAGASGQADAKAYLTLTVTAASQNFIYTTDSTLSTERPKTGNKYDALVESYAPSKTFQLYTTGNPTGSTVTYQLKNGSPTDVISVDPNGQVTILNASMNNQIGKVIVEATSHDPSGNYSDKTIELPINIEKGTRVVDFVDHPIYVLSGSGSVTPNVETDGVLDTSGTAVIEIDPSEDSSIAWTNDGVTIQYNWSDAQGKDIKIKVTKPADRNYKAADGTGILHILGADENVLTLSTPGKIIYGDHFTIRSTQDDSMSSNVQYTFETDNQVFISVPQVNGNKAEFDALAYSGSTEISIKVTRTADGELPLTKTVKIKVLPKPITIEIENKDRLRLEENPPLTYKDFKSQLVSWNGVQDVINESAIKLSTTAGKYSSIGSYPITSGNAQKQLNDNYPNYIFTIKEGLLNVKDNGDKNFWDVDDDGCPDLNIEIEDDEGNTILINGDKNDDGIPDYNIDINGDGKPDLNIDTDNDGKPDLNLVILKEWKPSKCITLGDIQFSIGINAKAEINIDLDNDSIPEINIDTDGDFKADFNISLDGETPILNIGKVPDEWKPETDYTHQKFSYDTMNELEPLLNIDNNGDDCADTNIDLDGDDLPDLNIDIDKDGIPDVNIDGDGDGKADLNLDRDDDGIAEENIVEITAWNPDTKIGQICTMIYNPDKEEEESKDEDKSNGEVLGSYYLGDHIGGALTGDTSHLMYHAGIIFLSMGMLSFLFFLNSHTDHNQ